MAPAPDGLDVVKRPKASRRTSDMSRMRIAVAGTGGLACAIATCIQNETSHPVVLLSRTDKSQLRENNIQVTVIDYNDPQSLTYALRGIDTVISTVTGPPQLALIQAAYACRVRRFAPAEFEGLPSLRPANHPLDRGRAVARQWLAHYAQEIQSTVFVCGILYERFQPGGLRAVGMANNTGSGNEGDYIMNCRSMVAHAPIVDANGQPNVTICMTAMNDVARFVTRALDLPQWPAELRMLSERVRVAELINTAQALRGRPFVPLHRHTIATLRAALQQAITLQSNAQIRLHTLIATAEGRYDYAQANMNSMFDIRLTPFQQWFATKWAAVQ